MAEIDLRAFGGLERDVKHLTERIEDLETKIENLEARISQLIAILDQARGGRVGSWRPSSPRRRSWRASRRRPRACCADPWPARAGFHIIGETP